MFRAVFRSASALDQWLHHRFGRAYAVFLSIGLIADIVHRVWNAAGHVEERHRLIGMALAVTMELALLLHQLGEMHERLGPLKGPVQKH